MTSPGPSKVFADTHCQGHFGPARVCPLIQNIVVIIENITVDFFIFIQNLLFPLYRRCLSKFLQYCTSAPNLLTVGWAGAGFAVRSTADRHY
jgi:hypothetical protein